MKKNQTISIAASILFTLVVLFIPQNIAAESSVTSVSANPSTGKVGSTISLVGQHFTGTLATVYWNKKLISREVAISPDGMFDYSMTIPEASKGIHTISVTDNSNWAGSAAETVFTVSSNIALFPDVIESSSSFTVFGHGFDKLEKNVKILLDGKSIIGNIINADENGNWSSILSLPMTKKGRHIISSAGSSTSAEEVGNLSLIIAPWLEITPLEGTIATQLIIYGWGLRQNEDGMTVTWDNKIIKTNIRAEVDGTLKIDGKKRDFGSFTSGDDYRESVFVPETTQGNHRIGVYGSSFTPKGTFPDYIFNVKPKLSIEPDSDKEAAIIKISGTGFSNHESVKIQYDDIGINGDIQADDNGSFKTEFRIPASAKKEHVFSATGNKGNSANTDFILQTSETIINPIIVSPPDKSTISIFNSIGDVYLGVVHYLIGLGDYLNGLNNPDANRQLTTLKWTIPDEVGSWNYIIQISRDDSFSNIVLEKHLQSKEYKLTQYDKITAGRFYLRVKGIADNGKSTQWSQVSQFTIISMAVQISSLSIIILLLAIAAILIIAFLIRANIRRRQY